MNSLTGDTIQTSDGLKIDLSTRVCYVKLPDRGDSGELNFLAPISAVQRIRQTANAVLEAVYKISAGSMYPSVGTYEGKAVIGFTTNDAGDGDYEVGTVYFANGTNTSNFTATTDDIEIFCI